MVLFWLIALACAAGLILMCRHTILQAEDRLMVEFNVLKEKAILGFERT